MTPRRSCVPLLFLTLQTCTIVYGDRIIQSSLTFAIDDTASMWNEIDQVKRDANSIFETVLTTNASQIENFVLVTFNDPDAQLRTITKDRDEFKRALAAINVHGGDDCPEYAMTGIETALLNSLPLSYLYVFTDASAKDHAMVDRINNLAQKRKSQVTFVLTGECGYRSDVDYQVYHKVAEATSGQVFHVMKDGITNVLKYVKETIKGRGDMLVNTKLPPGTHIVEFSVDARSGAIIISVTGEKATIGAVTGPDKRIHDTETIVKDDEVAVSKIGDAKPGNYTVELGGKSETHAMVEAKTTINFQHGFSTFEPSSISDTATKPSPDGNSFLSIKLNGEGVKLSTAKVVDLKDNVIFELPLKEVDEKEHFYVTPSFDPPHFMFHVFVHGEDIATKTEITRKTPTPIERQNPATEEKVNTAPVITIDGEPKINDDYDSPLQLKCKVHGYPQPEIVWEIKDTGTTLPAKVSVIDVPYDYISILDLEKGNKNGTYQCKASNPHGVNIKYVEVETIRKIYFDVIEAPKDRVEIQYNRKGSIVCKLNAYPLANITWYKDGRQIMEDPNIEISTDTSVLTIKHMQLESQGNFICEARNDVTRKVFHSNVVVVGLEEPKLNKSVEEVRVRQGSDTVLYCRVIRGIPTPSIRWYFRAEDKEKYTEMKETSDKIYLKKVSLHQAGSYKCIAKNIVGSDRYFTELQVEFPPRIKEDLKWIKSKDGDELILPCKADGVPAPTVKWFYKGTEVKDTLSTRIFRDYSLRLRATIADTGDYTCVAENTLGSTNSTIFVEIFVPIAIDVPKVTTIETMVGKAVHLPCRADGYTRPEIKWMFHSFDTKLPPKDIAPSDGSTGVLLRNAQLHQQGYYTCIASNTGGSANLTYEVKVFAPPIIENEYTDKTFRVIEGDLMLRIKCKATGSPKPIITWKQNDLNIAIGSEWYDMEADGTLLIKNIDDHTTGTYVCVAENKFGKDTEYYEVVVDRTPKPEKPTTTIFAEEGKTVSLKCDIPHKKTDVLRWYKHGKEIAMGELTLFEIKRSDDGWYTCRVSDFTKSRSATTNVKVGFKPKFITEEEEKVEFVEGTLAWLQCVADGDPVPKAIWRHNGKEISGVSDMTYTLEMKLDQRGIFDCEVTNDFGSIHRSFNVTSRDCILNIKEAFPDVQPLMISRSLTWPTFEITDGFMVIPHRDYFFLNCPYGFSNFPSRTNLMAFCEGESIMKINGELYNFSDVKCRNEVIPNVAKTGIRCESGNTEYIEVGYRVYSQILKVYDVCLDIDNNVTLHVKHKLSPTYIDSPKDFEWINSDLLPQDFDRMYDCRNQVDDIQFSLGKALINRYSCCFARRHLVNPRDLQPGIPATAAFSYLNVIPHWSTCNAKNWDDVEERVRKLVTSAGHDLLVTTGTAKPVRMRGSSPEISLRDGRGSSQPVGQYLWKVVQDPPSSTTLAIIQVNVPDLSSAEALRHVLCPDVCGSVDWMKSSNWKKVEDGYTYCCTIREFEKAFGFERRFSPGMDRVLFKTSLMPDYYLTKK